MSYDPSRAVAELMLEPEDLLEVYQSFFRETRQTLVSCNKALATANYDVLLNLFHSLKGSALNLRMTELAELLIEMENLSKRGERRQIVERVPVLEKKVALVETSVVRFYSARFSAGRGDCFNFNKQGHSSY